MEPSILKSVKKVIGIAETDTSFDEDILLQINGVFSTLTQLGLGPSTGFMIEDETTTWDAFFTDPRLNFVKTYVHLRVRLVFDPPGTSFFLEAMEKQIQELEFRMNVVREGDEWQDPTLPVTTSL